MLVKSLCARFARMFHSTKQPQSIISISKKSSIIYGDHSASEITNKQRKNTFITAKDHSTIKNGYDYNSFRDALKRTRNAGNVLSSKTHGIGLPPKSVPQPKQKMWILPVCDWPS